MSISLVGCMPRIHYPKEGGTSNARWPACRRRWPRPAAGGPFITKAHETLTRRLGESCISVSRLPLRPAYHGPNGLVEAVPIARGLAGSRPPPGRAVVVPFPKGSVCGPLLEGAFSEVALASRFLLAYRDTVNPQDLASTPEDVRPPRTFSAGLPKVFGLSTRGPHPLVCSETLRHAAPPRLRARYRGATPVHSVTQKMVIGWFSCPSPARPCSESRLVLAPDVRSFRLGPVRPGPHVLAEPPS